MHGGLCRQPQQLHRQRDGVSSCIQDTSVLNAPHHHAVQGWIQRDRQQLHRVRSGHLAILGGGAVSYERGTPAEIETDKATLYSLQQNEARPSCVHPHGGCA